MHITTLREAPHFAETVANRGWNAWWRESGTSLDQYRAHLDPMINGADIPFCLVAHEGDLYRGSVLVIDDDLEVRPQYAPWIAALWVEEPARRRGIATLLLEAARTEAASRGKAPCYLCATPEKDAFYLARGFALIETGVLGLNVFCI